MIRKDLNIKKFCKKTLEEEECKIVKDLHNSDLDHESYMQELAKIEKLEEINGKNKKPKIDWTQIIVASISAVSTIGMFTGLLLYENREVIHAKRAMSIAEKGAKLK